MLIALEDSKVRVVANTSIVPPGHPFRDPHHWLYTHPQNPFHPDHVNDAGERVRNGYPTSAWTWVTVSREWWAVMRARLWSRVVLRGAPAYKGFLALLQDPDSCFIRDFVHTLVLGEGAEDTFHMYAVVRAIPAVQGIVYKPWPPQANLKTAFGVNILPTNPGLTALAFPEVPFDRVTNPTTREHLRNLPRLRSLDLRLDTLSSDIGHLFATLSHLRRISLRLPSVHPSQLAPFATPQTARVLGEEAGGAADEVQAQDGRAHLEVFEIRATIVHDDVLPELRAFLAADSRLGPITTIYRGTGSDQEIAYAPAERAAVALELVEIANQTADEKLRASSVAAANSASQGASGSSEHFARGSVIRMSDVGGKDHWQRSTNLRMFGGLINLRMESRK
jgi:hypothetical protein